MIASTIYRLRPIHVLTQYCIVQVIDLYFYHMIVSDWYHMLIDSDWYHIIDSDQYHLIAQLFDTITLFHLLSLQFIAQLKYTVQKMQNSQRLPGKKIYRVGITIFVFHYLNSSSLSPFYPLPYLLYFSLSSVDRDPVVLAEVSMVDLQLGKKE